MDKIKAAIWGAFAADSFSLAAHWVYDTRVIAKEFGVLSTLESPLPESYHPNRSKGEFTHYGDQTLWLLESLSENKGFDKSKFSELWETRMESYDGYVDGASKETLAKLKLDRTKDGSSSTDLAGVSRIAPLALVSKSKEELAQNAKLQTRLTHNSAEVVETSAFIAEWLYEVLEGKKPSEVLTELLKSQKEGSFIKQMADKALQTKDKKTATGVKRLGQACNIDGALPATIFVILKHEDSYENAMIENVNAGGDSSARGMIIGAILAAHHGIESIPKRWIDGMKYKAEIEKYLAN